jgi:hypothetical protein
MSASPRLEALLRAMVATIREPEAAERGAAFFADRGLDPRDQAALAAVEPQAMFTYRSLVRGTLRTAIENEIPRTAALLGPRFQLDLDRFFADAMPRSHYLRDVAFELVDFAAPGWAADPSVPPFTHDLARHELLDFEVAASPRGAAAQAAEPSLDLARPVVFDGAVRLARYDYPVHTIAAGVDVSPEETFLLVYRDAEFEIRHLALTPLAAAVTEALLAGVTLGQAVTVACEKLRATLSAETLEGVAKLLADYADRGVLIGSPNSHLPNESP